MANDRSSIIRIGDNDYELLLTTKATKEIAKRYGGLEKLGDKLLKNEDLETGLTEVIWLITILANQPILIHNFKNKENQKDLLTEEVIELFTTPNELGEFKEAITQCLLKGTKRNVVSEDSTKNVVGE